MVPPRPRSRATQSISGTPILVRRCPRNLQVESGWGGGRLDGGASIVLQKQREATGASSEALWLKDSLAEPEEDQPNPVNTPRLRQACAHMMTDGHMMLSGSPRPPTARFPSPERLTERTTLTRNLEAQRAEQN